MRSLFFGESVGKSGRDIVSSLLNSLKEEYEIDLTIANGENSAHGKGITYKIYNQLRSYGVDYITMGNHTYSKSEINKYIEQMDNLVVPYNHLKRISGNYYKVIEFNNVKFCLCNILGNVLMNETGDDMYEAFENLIDETKDLNCDFYFVDLHAETTAEKRIFMEYFKDYAKVVLGTHTHVQTADEDIINDCAFITDVGMCGAYESIIGRDVAESIMNNVDKEPTIYKIAEGPAIFCGVVIEIDEVKKLPVSIKRIQIRP